MRDVVLGGPVGEGGQGEWKMGMRFVGMWIHCVLFFSPPVVLVGSWVREVLAYVQYFVVLGEEACYRHKIWGSCLAEREREAFVRHGW